MKQTVALLLLAVALAAYTQIDFSVAETVQPDQYAPIWLPVVSTDCHTEWSVRQTDAAVEDVWPYVEYMSINETGRYDEHPVEFEGSPPDEIRYDFWAGGQVVYSETVELRVCG